MAHTEEMLINGVMTPVVKFDHSAQEIDDAVDKANNAVNKAGDTMNDAAVLGFKSNTGTLTEVTQVGNGLQVSAYANGTDKNNKIELKLEPASEALFFNKTVNGTTTWRKVFHEGNKPSGSYTGNGDATERRITTNGTGNVVAIWGGNQVTILTANGGFNYSQSSNAIIGVPFASARFANGTISIASTIGAVNASGVNYNYQVL